MILDTVLFRNKRRGKDN